MKTASDIGREITETDTAPMSRDQGEVFVKLFFAGPSFTLGDELEKSFPVQVFKKRMEVYGIDVEDRVIMWFCMLSRNVAECVMYVAVCHYIQTIREGKVMFTDISEFFPLGFPTEEAMNRIWDNQKVRGEHSDKCGSDNWIDHAAAWKVGE